MNSISVSGVCERDIDLLLLEELTASPPFVVWFLHRLGIKDAVNLLAVERSVHSSNGESDLVLTVQDQQGVARTIFIENKIYAPFQPGQPERYRDRGVSHVSSGACGVATTVILAPAVYFTDEAQTCGFDFRLTHEDLLGWFASSTDLGLRGAYKRALIEGAIGRGGTGWQSIPNEATTAFWQNYWRLATSLAPELKMPRPSEKPEDSTFIRFKPADLAADVDLLHKVRVGKVDIEFAHMGDRVLELEKIYSSRLQPGMRVERASKSAVVRIKVPEIDVSAPFSESESAVREGLRAATGLLTMYRSSVV